ncbi:iron ABC transporter permease [Prochlorococcus sp. MIT 1341]|uniref:ABC transporter permease n=1 Tax=Prochlorococcus sp. MIT 1341 TaxID=3096221 RepID=UPI002A75BC26|nr:iron ABC transporter permease [Prochlorococcus sp. MIT 1341]
MALIQNRKNNQRVLLNGLVIVIAIIVLSPLLGLINEGIIGLRNNQVTLGIDGVNQIKGTLYLLIGSALLGGFLGTANGWLLANCRFPGRRLLKIAQLIPFATPAYLLSATLIDLGSIYTIRIYGMVWGILVMTLTTYPYVFLLSTESFSKSGRRQLEACRSLGIGPWNSFRKVALPIAMPAIGAGIALMSMEIVNELGAVQLLNIPSISAGIVENWIAKGNPTGAIALALIALVLVITLVAYERILRSRSRRWTDGVAGGESPEWELKGPRAILAQLLGLLPPCFTLGVPLLWAFVNIEQLKTGLNLELIYLTARSLGLGLIAASTTLLAALILAIAKRWNTSHWIRSLTFLSGIGYAIPGAVLALALQSFSSPPLKLTPIILLIWGYSNRFLAVAKGGLDAALERLSPSLDEAATGLGCQWQEVFRRVHLPLLKGPIAVGALLVFVDTIKELPLTFVLRPFDFDTLSVRIFQYASDERMAESILPALMILFLGLIASAALIPGLESGETIVKKKISN